jgi:hypothetical protein
LRPGIVRRMPEIQVRNCRPRTSPGLPTAVALVAPFLSGGCGVEPAPDSEPPPGAPQIGWFVGYLEGPDTTLSFSLNLALRSPTDAEAEVRIAPEIFQALELIPPREEPLEVGAPASLRLAALQRRTTPSRGETGP